MDVFKVSGNGPLNGTIEVGGAKNAALPILAATLLTDETVVLKNVPDLSDMRFMIEILQHVGAETVQPEPGTWEITAKKITHVAPTRPPRSADAQSRSFDPWGLRDRPPSDRPTHQGPAKAQL